MNHYTYRSLLIEKHRKNNYLAEAAIVLGFSAIILLLIFFATHLWDVKSGEIYYVEGKVESRQAIEQGYQIQLKTLDPDVHVLEVFLDDVSYDNIEVGKYYSFGVRGGENDFLNWHPRIYRIKRLEV